ncbi:18254_t:CDS:2 [Funneliformis geosporum]|uniref:protein disulfide-isomerase n=1 Tax=Funneliformis geosporum TaxID=1117311 RepID=A0A9W4SN18_9GLOM|nr:11545_t:CDS:2 [Funneliformis geosporum]CAI2173210.1 18254_t:CDS:2 [Funneliformis geosporum]
MLIPLRILIASLAICISLPCILALYDKSGPVTLVTEKNFRDVVLLTEQVVLLEFFAPWCGHCKNLAPEYKKVAENLKGLVKVAAVDCDDQSNRNVCGAYDVKGFPTIKLFPSQAVPDKKNSNYNGPRTANEIVKFALSEIPSFVLPISNNNPTKKSFTIEEFLAKDNETMSKVILFTNKEKTTHLYKALSVEFHNRLFLGEVRQKESSVIEKFDIKKFPTLLAIDKNTNEITEFKGKFNYENLSKYLNKYALPKKNPNEKKPEKKKGPKIELEPYNPEILDANSQAILDNECLSKTGLCIFTFLPLETEFEESIKEHESNIKILKNVKESLHRELGNSIYLRFLWFNSLESGSKKLIKDFKLADVFPVLMILNPNRKVYRPYLGPFDEENIEKFLKEVIKGKGKSFEYDFNITLKSKREKDEL